VNSLTRGEVLSPLIDHPVPGGTTSLRKAAHLPIPPVLRAGISFDRKVRILLRPRKESTKLPTAPVGQAEVSTIEKTEEVTYSDMMSHTSQGVETVEDSKLKERRGNVYENKGSAIEVQHRSGNVAENKDSYPQDPGMLLKRQGVSFR